MPLSKHTRVYAVLLVLVVCSALYVYTAITRIPRQFPVNSSFVVGENESLRSVSERLAREGFVTSAFIFRAWVSFLGHDTHIQLGGYQFTSPLTLRELVAKIAEGKPDSPLITVTIPEGSTSSEIAEALSEVLPVFATSTFISLVTSSKSEGMLFPSTYFLLPSTSEEKMLGILVDTYKKTYKERFSLSELPEVLKDKSEVLVLASIVEGEAKSNEDKRIVAGILLARMEKKMPLQVDVALETYKKKGLPLYPINNPGVESIASVYNPIRTKYLFYLTGKDGKMYYATTFDEHRRNIAKYLK
jgi:UPF0755 protein